MRAAEAIIRMVLLVVDRQAARWADRVRDDRGDVPGWVLVTMMSAALVVGLLLVAGPALETAFETALESVVGP